MKKAILSLLLLVFVFATGILSAQTQFEGKLKFKTYEQGQGESINYFVKSNKFRIESPDDGMGQGYMIFNNDTKIMTMVMVDQQMYMEMPIDGSAQVMDDDEDFYFNNTGETMEINGYLCDKFEFADDEGPGIAWMTQELGPFFFLDDPEGNSQSTWQQQIMNEGYFPMLVEQENTSGELEKVFEIEEITPMPLDDNLFSIPSGFQKFDMPNMPNMNNFE